MVPPHDSNRGPIDYKSILPAELQGHIIVRRVLGEKFVDFNEKIIINKNIKTFNLKNKNKIFGYPLHLMVIANRILIQYKSSIKWSIDYVKKDQRI